MRLRHRHRHSRCDPRVGPPGKGQCEGRALGCSGPARLRRVQAHPLLMQEGENPLDRALSMGKTDAAALLEADLRVAAALAASLA